MAGCIPSLHPLYTSKDVIFDQSLLGAWTGEKKSGWTFSNEGGKYQAIYTDNDGKTGEFVAHLLKLNGTMFLDLFPADPGLAQNGFYMMHLVPAHSFLLVSRIDPVLELTPLSPNWLKNYLKEHPDAIAHEVITDEKDAHTAIVLTASTEQLQKFVLANLHTTGAFNPPTVWKRK